MADEIKVPRDARGAVVGERGSEGGRDVPLPLWCCTDIAFRLSVPSSLRPSCLSVCLFACPLSAADLSAHCWCPVCLFEYVCAHVCVGGGCM